jgi:tape measure domain-containing protein
VATLDQLVIKLEADIKGLKAGLAQAGGEVRGFSQKASADLGSVDRAVSSLKNRVLGLITVWGAFQVGKSVFQAGVQVESLNGKMLAAVGSAQAAQQSLQWLREESERLGLRFTTTADSFASFAAASTRAGLTLQQTREAFIGVTEAGVALRLSNEQMGGVMYALSQMASKGVISMEELRQQLGERLPIAMDAAGKALGVTGQDLEKMVASGAIAARDFLPAFGRAIRENLGDAVEVSSRSANAGFNRMMNAIDSLKQTMAGGGFLNSFSAAFDALATVVSQPGLVNALKNIVAVIAKIAQVVAESIAGISIMVNKLI